MNILIAEDDVDIRHSLRSILEYEGHACVEAGNGCEAKAVLESMPVFDLLFSDLSMPQMSGTELLHWCRDHGIKMPVIFFTAQQNLAESEKAGMKEDNIAFLRKPVDIVDILNAIQKARNQAQARKEDLGMAA